MSDKKTRMFIVLIILALIGVSLYLKIDAEKTDDDRYVVNGTYVPIEQKDQPIGGEGGPYLALAIESKENIDYKNESSVKRFNYWYMDGAEEDATTKGFGYVGHVVRISDNLVRLYDRQLNWFGDFMSDGKGKCYLTLADKMNEKPIEYVYGGPGAMWRSNDNLVPNNAEEEKYWNSKEADKDYDKLLKKLKMK